MNPSKLKENFAKYVELVEYFNSHWLNKDGTFYIGKLSEEVGEVAEACMATMYKSATKSEKILRAGQTPKERLTEELGDVCNILLTLAKVNNIEPEEIFEMAAKKVQRRIEKRMPKQEIFETLNERHQLGAAPSQ
jgi:NTP pyrophosphatase (non-canonical NTP hydrolase)